MRPGGNWRIWAAIVFGIAVWIGVTLEQNPRVTNHAVVNIPVDLQGLDPGLVSTLDPLPVDVLLQGLRDDLGEISVRNFRATLPLAGVGPGNHLIAVDLVLSGPDSIEIVEVLPAALPVTLVSLRNEQRQIELDFEVTPEIGYELVLEDLRLEPATVIISGPEPAVSRVTRIAATVVAEGLNRTQGLQLRARAFDINGAEVDDVTLDPSLFVVVLPVREIAVHKTVPVKVETAGSPAPGFALSETSVTPFSVEIKGTAAAVAVVNEVRTEPVVLRGQREAGTFPGRLVVPAGVELALPEQDYEINVNVTPIDSVVALADAIEFERPDDYVSTISPAVATIVLEGPSQRVFGLTPRDVATWIEIEGPTVEGVHILTPTVRAPAGIQVVSVEPVVVTLTLTARPIEPEPEPEPDPDPEAETAAPDPEAAAPDPEAEAA
ncbi:MAG: CdaR family protein [Chloroflexota bacterium]|nr:CdaR family protein [Chloroflexota bacterium]